MAKLASLKQRHFFLFCRTDFPLLWRKVSLWVPSPEVQKLLPVGKSQPSGSRMACVYGRITGNCRKKRSNDGVAALKFIFVKFLHFPGMGVLVLQDIDLAHFHGVKGILVALGSDAGAALAVDGDVFFGIEGFEQQGVGDHADVGAEAKQSDVLVILYGIEQGGAAEGRLFKDTGLFGKGSELRADFPAFLRFDAMLDGKFFALGCF